MGTDLVAIISAVSSQLPKACVEQGETAEQTIILKNVGLFWPQAGVGRSVTPSCHPAELWSCVFTGVLSVMQTLPKALVDLLSW